MDYDGCVRLLIVVRPPVNLLGFVLAVGHEFFGVCALCGVGFTMSLFIGSLAFEGMSSDYAIQVKLGVLGGSVVATLIGVSILLLCRAEAVRAVKPSIS